MARLHHERIARADTTPSRWLLFTHGIFGAGSNWRGIARKVNERRPDWGIVLVDLRLHGRSEAGDPPHTLDACAEDLRALIAELGAVEAIAGHSFGGKVVLATRPLVTPRQTWVLDASPGARADRISPSREGGERGDQRAPTADQGSSVTRVLALLDRLPRTWTRREDFVAAVVADGHGAGLAQWLAMNVVPDGGAYALRLDPAAMRELLIDYDRRDLWDLTFSPEHGEVDLVIADRSDTIDAGARARLERVPSHVHVHHIDAGHWLHIDAPAAVVELFATHLPGGAA